MEGRDSGVEKARHIQPIVSRDKAPARKPTNSALFARHREISVCMGLRGGLESYSILSRIKHLCARTFQLAALKPLTEIPSARTYNAILSGVPFISLWSLALFGALIGQSAHTFIDTELLKYFI